jgi:hypothetical protein
MEADARRHGAPDAPAILARGVSDKAFDVRHNIRIIVGVPRTVYPAPTRAAPSIACPQCRAAWLRFVVMIITPFAPVMP